MLVGVLTLALAAFSLDGAGMTLSVQIVDKGWLPVPGIDIETTQVESCPAGPPAAQSAKLTTDKKGWARFEVTGRATYRVSVKSQGGFRATSKCIRLYDSVPSESTAYLQLQVQVKEPKE